MVKDAPRQVALTADAIHDLQILGLAGEGTEQPVTPLQGLCFITVGKHRFQRQGSVAQPPVPVIPVP